MLFWPTIFVSLSSLAILGLFGVRWRGQRQMDRNHTTHELTFPRELDLATATRVFTALSGLYRPLQAMRDQFGRPTIVFELLSTADGLRHLISFPPNLADTVRSHILSIIPGAGMAPFDMPAWQWTHVVELWRRDDQHVRLDAKLMPVLLASLRELNDNEAVIVQLVTTPAGMSEDGKALFWAVVRLAASGHDIRAKELIGRALVAYRSLQVFVARRLPARWNERVNRRATPLHKWHLQLDGEALAVIWGVPIGSPQIPGLVMGRGRRFAPEPSIPTTGRVIAKSNFLGAERPIALRAADRLKHSYIVGPTGTGKSTLMENMAVGDIRDGPGVTVVDPKGDLVDNILDSIPRQRLDDVILFDVTDTARPVGFNVLAGENPYVVMGQLITVFDKLYDLANNAPRAIDVLRSTLLTLATAGMTLDL
jgi:hypothetical protein